MFINLFVIFTCFIFLIYFNWKLITLQFCGCFCHTLTWISHGCTCVPLSQTPQQPSCPSHPSGLSQCTSYECPVSCIELGLVIYFTYCNIYVSMLFSQITPPLPSPTSPKVCFLYLCLFCCLTYRVIIIIFLNSIYMHQYTVLVFFVFCFLLFFFN